MLLYFSYTVSAMLVFGAQLSVVEHPSQESRDLVKAIHTMNDSILKLFTEPPLYRLYPTKASRDFSSALSTAISISDKYLAAALQRSVPRHTGGDIECDMGVPFLRQWLEHGELTMEEVATHSIEMFVSGIDTVRNHLTHEFGTSFTFVLKRFGFSNLKIWLQKTFLSCSLCRS